MVCHFFSSPPYERGTVQRHWRTRQKLFRPSSSLKWHVRPLQETTSKTKAVVMTGVCQACPVPFSCGRSWQPCEGQPGIKPAAAPRLTRGQGCRGQGQSSHLSRACTWTTGLDRLKFVLEIAFLILGVFQTSYVAPNESTPWWSSLHTAFPPPLSPQGQGNTPRAALSAAVGPSPFTI